MIRAAALGPALALLAGPVLADTIACADPAGTIAIEIAVDFNDQRSGGEVTGVRLASGDYVLSTYPGETGFPPETIAFYETAFDSIEVGLESHGVGPMTLVVHIVRTAVFDPEGGPDRDVVAAGVANIGREGTAILVCTGW